MPEWTRRAAQEVLSAVSGVGAYEWHLRDDIVTWSPSLLDIFGIETAPASEREFTALVHPDDRVRVEAETSTFMGKGDTYAHEFRIVRPDGELRYIHDRGAIERDTAGRAVVLRGLNIDVTEQIIARRAIGLVEDMAEARHLQQTSRENEERLELAYSVAGIAAFDIDLETNSSHWSPKLYALLGLTGEEPASPELFLAHVHPEDVAQVRASYEAAISNDTLFKREFRIIRADGELRYLTGTGRVVEIAGGIPVRMIGVNYDITDRKLAEERRQLLMREINHREKNLLSLVQAIARQTSRGTHEQYLEKFSARLQSLTASQSLLLEEEWSGLDLPRVAQSQLAHFTDLIGTRLIIDGPPLWVAPAVGQTIGMALHELATNAAKYGALSVPDGRVELIWRCYLGNSGEQRFSMSWRERGGPKVREPERTGFGTVILERMLTSTLGGEVTLNYQPEGVGWSLDCSKSALHVGQDH